MIDFLCKQINFFYKQQPQSEIKDGNSREVENSDLVFILEEHGNKSHEKFFATIINHYADKTNDVVLLEESKDLTRECLYKKIEEKSKIKAISLKGMEIFGWDHPEKENWLNAIRQEERKLQCSLKVISKEQKYPTVEKIQAFAYLTACHNTIYPQSQVDGRKYVMSLAQIEQEKNELSPLKEELSQVIVKFHTVATKIMEQKKKELVFSTFTVRQESLEKTIQKVSSFLQKKENKVCGKPQKIFISLGEHHGLLSPSDNPFYEQVNQFFMRIDKRFKYVLLKPL